MHKYALAASLAFLLATPASPQETENSPCRTLPNGTALDFWLGDWTVQSSAGEIVGHNRIYPILHGCAIREEWRGADGGEGRSLFYYDGIAKNWEQVWVTEDTSKLAGLKRKSLVRVEDDGSTIFAGEPSVPGGGTYHDRTKLQPLGENRVRQIIEFSTDGGKTWNTGFDAIYVRDSKAESD